MARRRRNSLRSESETRMRVTVSIPKGIMELIPSDSNFSGIVTQLLDENLERLTNEPLEEIQKRRTEHAVRMILGKINDMTDSISKTLVQQDNDMFQQPMQEVNNTLRDLKHTEAQLNEIKQAMIERTKIRRQELHTIIKEEIHDIILKMVGEQNLVLLQHSNTTAPATGAGERDSHA